MINAAVEIAYRRAIVDAYIHRHFENVGMTRQKARQKAFLTMAFAGPNCMGKGMRNGTIAG